MICQEAAGQRQVGNLCNCYSPAPYSPPQAASGAHGLLSTFESHRGQSAHLQTRGCRGWS